MGLGFRVPSGLRVIYEIQGLGFAACNSMLLSRTSQSLTTKA